MKEKLDTITKQILIIKCNYLILVTIKVFYRGRKIYTTRISVFEMRKEECISTRKEKYVSQNRRGEKCKASFGSSGLDSNI
jgi:hypothetical protein